MIGDISWLERALEFTAKLVVRDPYYTPIFERIELELAVARGSAVERARLIARNRASRAPSEGARLGRIQ